MVEPTLHFICGKLASGKTTLARRIANETGAIIICEDEWLTRLFTGQIKTFRDYLDCSRRLRGLLGGHVQALLRSGVSVAFDFAGNTPQERQWVRSLFDGAGAAHRLHYLSASDDVCKAQLRHRNETRPEGLYWASTTEAEFDEITRYFVAPDPAEGFEVVGYEVERPLMDGA